MTDRIEVSLGERSYPVLIEDGLVTRAGSLLAPLARSGRIAVVSDETVWEAQGPRLSAGLAAAGMTPVPVVVPPGEVSKSWKGLEALLDRLLALELERGDHLLAFGGGMVGDLAGLAASLIKRGCGLVQIPTSLLAQVDSAVGGKTAINAAAGKNLIGTFHQPSLVLVDPSCLDSLPLRQIRAGYAEIVKYGLIDDPDFFHWCEDRGPSLLAGDPQARHHAIRTSIAAKARIVAADERETAGRRALLNLGHSFAHAIEAEAGYSDGLLHGEAVAVGIAMAFRLSVRLGHCPEADARRVETCLGQAGLPATIAQARVATDADLLLSRLAQDKKAAGGALPLILVRGIGRAFVEHGVERGELRAFLETEIVSGPEEPASSLARESSG